MLNIKMEESRDMTHLDREKAKLYAEFYSHSTNRKLLESHKIDDNIEYFRRFKAFYEQRVYGEVRKKAEVRY